MTAPRHIANRLASSLVRLAHGDAGAGVILLACAVIAMVLANSPLADAWHSLLHAPSPWAGVTRLPSLHHWINDGLMALFFFVVGLEIKREVVDGELSSPARRRLPVLAALAGMAAPALVFLAVVRGNPEMGSGWAIPAATDIAFAVGILALAGKGLPSSLRLFLLTVAIVDDLGAVTIIALFYTPGISASWGLGAVAAIAGMALLNRLGGRSGIVYAALAIMAWACTLHSGIHATVAGVLAAFTIPMKLDSHGDSLLLRMEHALTPWSAYLIVPLFGMANAGVHLGNGGGGFSILSLAVALGLFFGKPAGILGAIWLAERSGFASRPHGATWAQVWGLAALAGIGFTMSLFIGALAFPLAPDLVDQAKFGILAGSILSGLMGFAVLRFSRR